MLVCEFMEKLIYLTQLIMQQSRPLSCSHCIGSDEDGVVSESDSWDTAVLRHNDTSGDVIVMLFDFLLHVN